MDTDRKLTAAELTALYDEDKAALLGVELAAMGAELGYTGAEQGVTDAEQRLGAAVSDVDALEINAFLASTMISDRYGIVKRLRNQSPPVSWSRIGDTLGMSKQAAHQWYGTYNLRPSVKNPTDPA